MSARRLVRTAFHKERELGAAPPLLQGIERKAFIKMINVVVASSIYLFREGMKAILHRNENIRVCAEATCMEDALEHDFEGMGKIVLIASPLPWRHGPTPPKPTADKKTQRVIFITHGKNLDDVQMALQLGVRAILTKACSIEQIIHAVRTVDAGKIYVSQEIAMLIATSIKSFSSVNPLVRLTQRELDILKRIAIGRKMSTIGGELGISSKTVSAHKANIMEKLALSSESELVLYAIKNDLFDLFVDHSRRKQGCT